MIWSLARDKNIRRALGKVRAVQMLTHVCEGAAKAHEELQQYIAGGGEQATHTPLRRLQLEAQCLHQATQTLSLLVRDKENSSMLFDAGNSLTSRASGMYGGQGDRFRPLRERT